MNHTMIQLTKTFVIRHRAIVDAQVPPKEDRANVKTSDVKSLQIT